MSLKKFTVERRDIIQLNNSLSNLLASKDVSLKLARVLTRNKIAIRDMIDEKDDQVKRFNKIKDELLVEHCQKDASGNPVIAGGNYAGLMPGQVPEFTEASDVLALEMTEYLRESVDVSLTVIDEKWLKKSGSHVEGVFFLLDTEQVVEEVTEEEDDY